MIRTLGLAAASPAILTVAIALAGLGVDDLQARELRMDGVRAIAWQVTVGGLVILSAERVTPPGPPGRALRTAQTGRRRSGDPLES